MVVTSRRCCSDIFKSISYTCRRTKVRPTSTSLKVWSSIQTPSSSPAPARSRRRYFPLHAGSQDQSSKFDQYIHRRHPQLHPSPEGVHHRKTATLVRLTPSRIQSVSATPATKQDVLDLQEKLDKRLQQRQARETGICPIREELYSQCFDELIRQITINCAERGLLLVRVRDEIRSVLLSSCRPSSHTKRSMSPPSLSACVVLFRPSRRRRIWRTKSAL